MAVLEFRTYQYKVFDKPGKVTIDENGDPIVSNQAVTDSSPYPCDIEASGIPNTIQTQDGKIVTYSYTVHGDRVSPELHIGQRIQILDSAMNVIFDGQIKGFKKLQLQTLIWV